MTTARQPGIDALKAVQAAAGSGTTPTPVPDLPTIAVTPTSLDFGTTQTELGITVTRINGSSDTPTRFATSAIDPAAVTVAVPSGTTNPPAGPFRFVVRVESATIRFQDKFGVIVLDGVLRTYPLSNYILPGITRAAVPTSAFLPMTISWPSFTPLGMVTCSMRSSCTGWPWPSRWARMAMTC